MTNSHKVRRVNVNGTYYYEVRVNGKIDARKKVKGSKTNRAELEKIYNDNKTFNKNIKRNKEKLTNVNETTILSETTIENRNKKLISRKPSGKVVQYQVQGYNGKELIVARSQRISQNTRAKNSQQAKNQAWESFLERVAQANGLTYDADEGLKKVENITGLKEGWVAYT